MEYNHSLEQAAEYSQLALSIMDDREIVAHPNNFTVWYNYFSGAYPDLKRTLDILLDNDQELNEARGAEVFRKFCANPFDVVPLHLMAEKMEVELRTVMAVLEQAGKGAADYGKTLETASGEIAELPHAEKLTEVVARLVRETLAMATQSREAERRLNESAVQVRQLTEELESARRDAMIDPLTGLANRKLLDNLVRQAAMASVEHGEPLSLLFADVDHFKKVNDEYGHQVGDQVLKLLASILQRNIRGLDTAGRYGGEEFAVLLPQTPLDGAVKVARTICNQVAGKSIVHRKSGKTLGQVTVSIGAAQYVPGEPVRQFVERADAALYAAKTSGRNRVVSEKEVLDETTVAVV